MNRTLPTPWKPTKAQVLAAGNKLVPDLIAKDLVVLFAGINPGLYTAAIGRHFGRPGNRFWPALYGGGFTPRLFSPFESALLLDLNLGITNIVARATARADELGPEEFLLGARILNAKITRLQPRWLAIVGVTAYRATFGRRRAAVGPQGEAIGETRVWVLPIPAASTLINTTYAGR